MIPRALPLADSSRRFARTATAGASPAVATPFLPGSGSTRIRITTAPDCVSVRGLSRGM